MICMQYVLCLHFGIVYDMQYVLCLIAQNYCMNQFTTFNSKMFPQSSRKIEQSETDSQCLQIDQLLDNEASTLERSKYRKNKSLISKSRHGEEYCPAADMESFNKTSSKLFQVSFGHHDPHMCVCDSCNCGRHLCKFKTVKPDLTKGTVYGMSYDKKKPIPNNVNKPSEYDKLNGPHLDFDTNYKKFYDGKKGDPADKIVPQDLLKSGGPCQQLTSYTTGFPGYRGPNQYVKPIESFMRSDLPMMSKTTYTNSFVPKSVPKAQTERMPDNLKNRDLWMGKTTYGNFYQQPNPQDYAKRSKNNEKAQNNPNYNRQFETTYKNSFLGPAPAVCPAKIAIETRAKGFFSSSKQRFTENSDYKAMNPAYHAISTSKHSYV